MSKQTVLIVSPVATHPPIRGNRQRILQVASIFKSYGFEVQLAIPWNRHVTDEAMSFWDKIHRLSGPRNSFPTKRNVELDNWYNPRFGKQLASTVRANNPDVVLMNYVFHSKALELLPPSVFKIIDTHDVFTDRWRIYRELPYSRGFFSCSAESERTYLNRADLVIAISQADQEEMQKIGVRPEVLHLPFAWKDGDDNQVQRSPIKPLKFGTALSSNDLNLSNLSEFILAVDRIYGRNVPFSLSVMGEIDFSVSWLLPHRFFSFRRPWLRYVGKVPDPNSFFAGLDASIIPVATGSGIAIKFAEAIGRGLPTISTRAGSRGHFATHPYHLLETIGDLAQVLGTLDYTDLEALRAESRAMHKSMSSLVNLRSTQVIHKAHSFFEESGKEPR